MRRHESLRTRFAPRGESAVQMIDPPWQMVLEPVAADADTACQRAEALMQQPFDLARDRLLRAGLLRLAPDAHVLVLSMHHAVSDGWSMGVLVGELEALYAAFTAGPAVAAARAADPICRLRGVAAALARRDHAAAAARSLDKNVGRRAGGARACHRPAAPGGAELPRRRASVHDRSGAHIGVDEAGARRGRNACSWC